MTHFAGAWKLALPPQPFWPSEVAIGLIKPAVPIRLKEEYVAGWETVVVKLPSSITNLQIWAELSYRNDLNGLSALQGNTGLTVEILCRLTLPTSYQTYQAISAVSIPTAIFYQDILCRFLINFCGLNRTNHCTSLQAAETC